MLDHKKVLRDFAMFVNTLKNEMYTTDGKPVGHKNPLKQMFGQSGQTALATINLDGQNIDVVLNNWCISRDVSGYDGQKAMPNAGGCSIWQDKYLAGNFQADNLPTETAYLVTWLAASIVNGRPPTTNSVNLENSQKAYALLNILTDEKNPVKIEKFSIPGPTVGGIQCDELVYSNSELLVLAKTSSQVIIGLLDKLTGKVQVREGIVKSPAAFEL